MAELTFVDRLEDGSLDPCAPTGGFEFALPCLDFKSFVLVIIVVGSLLLSLLITAWICCHDPAVAATANRWRRVRQTNGKARR